MNKYVIGVLAGLLLGGVAWAQSALPVMELTDGMHRIEAEAAANGTAAPDPAPAEPDPV